MFQWYIGASAKMSKPFIRKESFHFLTNDKDFFSHKSLTRIVLYFQKASLQKQRAAY